MSYKIVVLDIDGTLTNSKKELTELNCQTIKALASKGVITVLASGRPTYGIVPLAKELELESSGGYILSYNGGQIIEVQNGKLHHSAQIPMDLLPILESEATAAGCTLISYDNEYVLSTMPNDKYVQIEANLNRMQIKEVASVADYLKSSPTKTLAVGEPQKVLALCQRLQDIAGDRLNIFRSEPFFLEIVPPGIDKALSLERLLKHLGLEREDMIAFGDGFNDLSMIEYAGCGVAMKNAQDAVKDKANAITSLSNDEDGVAHYLKELYQL